MSLQRMAPQPVATLMLEGVDQGVFPGAQLTVEGMGQSYSLAVGTTAGPSLANCREVTPDTRFDVASLTKVLCTSILLMQAVDGLGAALLEQPASRWVALPSAMGAIQIGDLASHRAGLAAHRPFFDVLRAEGPLDRETATRRMLALIADEPLVFTPGTTTLYSDLGYIILGSIIEALFEDPLDELFERRVARPLGLRQTGFGPITGAVAATEADENGELLVGRVHDENCRAMGGVAGHAGLFSTALETLCLVRHLAAVHGGIPGLVSTETVRRFFAPIEGSTYTLGWDTPGEVSTSGRYTTRGATVGHLGFTGCSLWHDLARDVSIVLLSNRVHPSRENLAIRRFRPLLHDEVALALITGCEFR